MPELPAHPSIEHLRKEAKRVARERTIKLAQAQRALANEYGFPTWGDLIGHVEQLRSASTEPPIFAAVRSGDLETLQRLLAEGVNPRLMYGGEMPMHVAARVGPAALVETLIAGGAFEWQRNAQGETPLAVARRSTPLERDAIIAVLDRYTPSDPSFAAAVAAIHAGDVPELARVLDAEPRLLRDRVTGPEAYRLAGRHSYFMDPKLFWFVANNPTLTESMPPNVIEIARVMIERGVEPADLDYALGLVMTSSVARTGEAQRPLMRVLVEAGAGITRESILSTAAHWELGALQEAVACGYPFDALVAAALGDEEHLRGLLDAATREDTQDAFGLAVINRHLGCARIALDAGADVNAFLPIHAHSTALHQAALDDDVAMIEFLIERGANTQCRDTLWDGTPLGWAIHSGRAAAIDVLQRFTRA